jgi:hypothetical protein
MVTIQYLNNIFQNICARIKVILINYTSINILMTSKGYLYIKLKKGVKTWVSWMLI